MANWLLKCASYKTPDDIYNLIKSGKKSIETRPYNPGKPNDYSKIKSGDIITFLSLDSGNTFTKTATSVHVYPTISAMVMSESPESILPGIGDATSLIQLYEELKKKWGSEYAYKLDTYGIVAIGLS